jgi:ActR/RegA family two-component response regulator
VRAPTRALIVEDIESWMYTLSRAARRAGASEVIVCQSLEQVRDALREARFDIAILDVGLDPDDDVNADGITALEMIRETDGGGTRCILVTGWQGGDRMDLQASAQQKYGVDWAYMKEKYEAYAVIAKLTELLEQATERRLSLTTLMANLSAGMEIWHFEGQLLEAISPKGGVQTLYAAASRLISSAIPLLARSPDKPMETGPDGAAVGVYWSRGLAAAVAVGFTSARTWRGDEGDIPVNLQRFLPANMAPDLIDRVRERDVLGWLWELPGVDRDEFVEN